MTDPTPVPPASDAPAPPRKNRHHCSKSGLPMSQWVVGPCPGCKPAAASPAQEATPPHCPLCGAALEFSEKRQWCSQVGCPYGAFQVIPPAAPAEKRYSADFGECVGEVIAELVAPVAAQEAPGAPEPGGESDAEFLRSIASLAPLGPLSRSEANRLREIASRVAALTAERTELTKDVDFWCGEAGRISAERNALRALTAERGAREQGQETATDPLTALERFDATNSARIVGQRGGTVPAEPWTALILRYETTLRVAERLMTELVYGDDCQYDHHGYCQAHNLHERPCPHERAKAALAARAAPGEPT